MADFALVGLGNPGMQYAMNRHNIGFMLLDILQDMYPCVGFKVKNSAAYTELDVVSSLSQNQKSARILLIKPQTFMNLSGRGVAPFLSFFKIPLSNLIVCHDELDLEPGRIKIKKGGSSGGHNGLKSLDSSVGNDYWRIRIGIGHPGHKDAVSSYVLSNFRQSEIDSWVVPSLNAMAKHMVDFITTQNSANYIKNVYESAK